MKNTPLILSIIAIVAVVALGIDIFSSRASKKAETDVAQDSLQTAAHKGAIVYFNMDKVLSDYDLANERRSAVESRIQSINQEVTRRGNKLQTDFNSFQEKIDKGLMTRSTAEVQGQRLQEQKNAFEQYAAQKNQEISEEQTVMMNQIGDAIKKFIDKYNESKQYALILATQGDILPAPVVAGDKALDITEEIIAGLNEEYVKERAKAADKK